MRAVLFCIVALAACVCALANVPAAEQEWVQPELLPLTAASGGSGIRESADHLRAATPIPRFREMVMRKRGFFDDLLGLGSQLKSALGKFVTSIKSLGDKNAAKQKLTSALANKKSKCNGASATSAQCKSAMTTLNIAAKNYQTLLLLEQVKKVVELYVEKGWKAVKEFVKGVGKLVFPHTLMYGIAGHLGPAGGAIEKFIDCATHEIASVTQKTIAIGTDSVSVGADAHIGVIYKNGAAAKSVREYGNSVNFCAAGGVELEIFAGAGVIGGACYEIHFSGGKEHVMSEIQAVPKKHPTGHEINPVTIFGGLSASAGLKIPGVHVEANLIAMCGKVTSYSCENSTKQFILNLLAGRDVKLPFNILAAGLAVVHWALTHEEKEDRNEVFCSAEKTRLYNLGQTLPGEPAHINKNKGGCVEGVEKMKSLLGLKTAHEA